MMKKIIILFQFCLVSIVLISFTLAYTAQGYGSVDLVLDMGYTSQGNLGYAAQDYDSVDLILGLPDTCNCPASGQWNTRSAFSNPTVDIYGRVMPLMPFTSRLYHGSSAAILWKVCVF